MGLSLPKLPNVQQFLNMGLTVLLVMATVHFFPMLKFWERFPAFGRQST